MKKLLVVLGVLVLMSSTAWAHSLTVTATASCVNNAPVISYTATSWVLTDLTGSNPEIDILFNGSKVDAQPFSLSTTPMNQFSGQKPAPAAASVTVEGIAVGTWADGFGNGQTSSVTISIPTNCAPAPPPPKYFVDYYCNNGIGPVDQVIRIVNVGVNGTPLTTPVGDICANVYVFDNTQEMVTCCACRITPNEFAQAFVHAQLANIHITVTPVEPICGVIKVATTPATGSCDPTSALTGADAGLAQVFGTHKQITGGATLVTEAEKRSSPLSSAEAGFLPQACSFARYLGSGFGVCSCGPTGIE